MKKYLINTAWMLLEKILKLIFTFVFTGLIAKQIGASQFGLLSLGLSFVSILWVLGSLGLDNILLKEFSQSKFSDEIVFSTVFLTRAIFSILLIIISVISVYFYFSCDIKNYSFQIFVLLIVSLPFYNYYTYNSYYQAKSKGYVITIVSMLSLIISSCFKVCLLMMHCDVIWFAFSFSLDIILNLSLIWFISNHIKILKINFMYFRFDVLKNLLSQSFPMLLSGVIIIIYTRIDQVMVAFYLGTSDTGIYSVAMRITEAYAFVPALIATSFYPLLAKDFIQKNIKIYFDFVFFSGIVTAFSVFVMAPIFIPILFGQEFIAAIPMLNIMLFSTLFSILGMACTSCLVIENLGYFRLIRIILGLIVNVVLNMILIPKYGIWGAASASLVSQIFASWIGNFLNKRTRLYAVIQTRTVFTLGILGTLNLLGKRSISD